MQIWVKPDGKNQLLFIALEVSKHTYLDAYSQGAEVVKEDLIDDIARESGPYHPPEKIMRRSDMATDFSAPQQRTVKPNE